MVLSRLPSTHSSLWKSSSSQSEVQSQDFVIGGGGDGDVGGVGGGGDGGSTSLSSQISSPKLILSAQGLATLPARLISGVGGSGRLPPLAAARVRGRFAGGDPAGGDVSTRLTVEGTSPLSLADSTSAAVDMPAVGVSGCG